MDNKPLPIAVKNLRKIWDSKKLDIKFTQVTAAKELGWSQGAISHYLNDITELGPAAVVKFANFLDVDPREIDPTIEPNLPSVQKKTVKYSAEDMTKAINQTLSDRKLSSSILVKIPKKAPYLDFFQGDSSDKSVSGVWPLDCYARLVKTSDLHEPKMYAARLKNKKGLLFYPRGSLPNKSKIQALWSVVSFSYY